MKRRCVTVCLWLCALLMGCRISGAQPQLFQGDHAAMGTVYSIALYAGSADAAKAALQAAFDEVDRVDELLSNYKATSEISRINALAGANAGASAVTTDPETFQFIAQSLEYSRLTAGAFDITVGRLLRSWGFFEHDGKVPSAEQRAADRAGVGWQHVRLNAATRSVEFVNAHGLELDPGGIGKGYAVDRVTALLRELGVIQALISAGSSTIAAIGAPAGKHGWTVQIPDPRHAGAVLQTIELHDMTLSTSSCSEKHFVEHGHLYCHIFDPRTMVPVEGMLQTTVLSPLAVDSDALSTALFVADAADRARILERRPDDAALVIFGTPDAATMDAIRWPDGSTRTKTLAAGVKESR